MEEKARVRKSIPKSPTGGGVSGWDIASAAETESRVKAGTSSCIFMVNLGLDVPTILPRNEKPGRFKGWGSSGKNGRAV
jgi:hypothetical protein